MLTDNGSVHIKMCTDFFLEVDFFTLFFVKNCTKL